MGFCRWKGQSSHGIFQSLRDENVSEMSSVGEVGAKYAHLVEEMGGKKFLIVPLSGWHIDFLHTLEFNGWKIQQFSSYMEVT